MTERGWLLRVLMPSVSRHPREGKTTWTPEADANLFSRLTFTYLTPLMNLGYVQPLVPEDLPDVNPFDDSRLLSDGLQEALKATSSEDHRSGLVIKSVWEANKVPFMRAGGWKLIQDGLQLTAPIVLEFLLRNVEEGLPSRGGTGYGLWYNGVMVVVLFAVDQARNLFQNLYFHQAFRVGMTIKTGLIDAIFKKSLRVSGAVRGEMGIGKIVNLQSNDGSKLWGTAQFLHQIWSAPMQVLITIGLLMRVLQPVPALVGLATTLCFIPINMKVGKKLFATRRALIAKTDKRVKMTTEVLQGIKAIKLYAWEEPYLKRVGDLRDEELRQIIKTGFLGLINIVLFLASPVLVAITAFATFVAMGNELTASKAFPALALFNLIRFPIMMLPMIINQVINAKVSGKRLQDFFDSEEASAIAGRGESATPILCRDASFQWSTPPPAAAEAGAGKPGARPGPPAGVAKSFTERAKSIKMARMQTTPKGPVQLGADGPGAGGEEKPPAAEGFKLGPVSFEVARGSLLMVVGEVGSGKTSLLMGLLREMSCKGGDVTLTGTVAYTSQDPWIQNNTLEKNVLMGLEYDEERYEKAIVASALMDDLMQLPAADQTEIGEKGVNLSGGQKHRVALARAVYADADIYLLDDPLSAVDAHVAQHLFGECIAGVLKDKTRILVTHQLQFLAQADQIMVMEGGKIAHVGTFEELKGAGVSFTKYEMADKKEDRAEGGGDADADAGAELDKQMGRTLTKKERTQTVAERGGLTKAEGRAVGSVSMAIYRAYFMAWGAFYLYPILTTFFALGDRGLQAGQQYWLALWSNETADMIQCTKWARSTEGVQTACENGYLGRKGVQVEVAADGTVVETAVPVDVYRYLWVYTVLGLASVVLTAVRSGLIVLGSNNASRNLGNTLLAHVIRLPMSFFDAQPLGRLLNRFTSDLDAIDTNLSQTVSSTITTLVNVLAAIALMMVVTPEVAVAILLVGVFYWRIQQVYVATSREVKRLDSVSLSPIFSLFSETISGLPTVRAFGKQKDLMDRNLAMLNTSNRAYWPHMSTNRWLSVRLETLGNAITTASALMVTVITVSDAGFAGLVISSAMSITGVMNWLVRQVSEMEVAMNAVERIVEYRRLPTEAPAVIDHARPDPSWPTAGAVEVRDLQVRYRSELDLVLKGVSVSIAPREKVGVCGRTGCGKSTFMLALYRIVEPAAGTVLIDGVDVSKIGLFDLRSKLALVPQDPVLFSGTIRTNLDPFETVEDDEVIWNALRQVHLRDPIEQMGGLDASVAEAGSNLSVGQRQLLCMARALLRNSRILLLDEATSSVDNNTDSVIQATIRQAFAQCTVLTIAHRLNTIIDSDKIMLLDRGNLREFDHPHTLLETKGSAFAALVDNTSKGSSIALRRAAAEAAAKKGLGPAPAREGSAGSADSVAAPSRVKFEDQGSSPGTDER